MLFGKNSCFLVVFCSLGEKKKAFYLVFILEHLSSALFTKNGAREINCSHKYYFYNRVFILPHGLVEFRAAELKKKTSFPALKSLNT